MIVLLAVPATLLQVGLRDGRRRGSTSNDSTYQIELAGDLVRHGHNPYGHDYGAPGWSASTAGRHGPPPAEHPQVALAHFAYFPGTALTAAAWSFVPSPLDDYRLLVLLATLGCFFAVLLFGAPLPWRLALGAAVAANPLASAPPGSGRPTRRDPARCSSPSRSLTRSALVWAARRARGARSC